MMALSQTLQRVLQKGQGTAVRTLDHLPRLAQHTLAKALNYPYDYPQLDPLIKCMMAAQLKQGNSGFIGADVQRARKAFDLQMQSLKNKSTFVKQVQDVRLPLNSGDLFARHYHPAPGKKRPMLVFYHGGGFVVGSLNSHDEVCRLLAVYAQVQVLSIDYPLAPEASPMQLIQSCEDALAWVYQNKKQFNILKDRISVAGDSAGGNIATVVAQRSADKAYAPQAQLLLYPTVDFKSRHPSFYSYEHGLPLTGSDVDWVTHHYAHTHQVKLDDPIISPTYAVQKNLAPAFIVTAGYDLLHDEGQIYAYKLRHHGIAVYYQDYQDQSHGFANLTIVSGQAKKYLMEISKNYRKFWDRQR